MLINLLIVLKNTEHPIHCMFFNKKIRQRVFSNFPPDTPIFTVKVNQKNETEVILYIPYTYTLTEQ